MVLFPITVVATLVHRIISTRAGRFVELMEDRERMYSTKKGYFGTRIEGHRESSECAAQWMVYPEETGKHVRGDDKTEALKMVAVGYP